MPSRKEARAMAMGLTLDHAFEVSRRSEKPFLVDDRADDGTVMGIFYCSAQPELSRRIRAVLEREFSNGTVEPDEDGSEWFASKTVAELLHMSESKRTHYAVKTGEGGLVMATADPKMAEQLIKLLKDTLLVEEKADDVR